MFEKVLFFCVFAYFIYQLYVSFKEKSPSKKITGLAIGITILLFAFVGWPFYINIRLTFSLLTLLYSIGMFIEWRREKKSFYFLTSIILLVLSGIQFAEYLDT